MAFQNQNPKYKYVKSAIKSLILSISIQVRMGYGLYNLPYYPNKYYVNRNGSKTTPQRRGVETELHLLYHCKNQRFCLVAEPQKSRKLY